MSVSGDTADQLVKLGLDGFEVLARLTGTGAKNIATLLYTITKDQQQTKGKTRLNNLLKSGKALKIFSINKDDLKVFSQVAKNYGILYTALIDKNNKSKDGMIDIMVRDEDASRVNRIVEKFKLIAVDTAEIKTVVTKSIEDRQMQNSNLAMTVKNPQSELSLNNTVGVANPSNTKKSVRKELAEIKDTVRKEAEKKALSKLNIEIPIKEHSKNAR